MGSSVSAVCKRFMNKKEMRLVFMGLDAAGKTTILYKLKLGEVVTTIPTIGFNVEAVEYKNVSITSWDVGGRDKIRPLRRHYYQNTDALVFVVDSNDRERLEYAREELHDTLGEDQLKDATVLVFANKQDLPNAMSKDEVVDGLGLKELRSRQWAAFGCTATAGDGLYEGLEWLTSALASSEVQKAVTEPVSQTVTDAKGLSSSLLSPVSHWFKQFKSNNDWFSQISTTTAVSNSN
ncbi:uncharacterized protein LOC135818867 [Sycon ciliatum]|uniref:uncharacterized protein LOC135818867 n=1 Tax=Sycon ciliatum TaxID=27933 RepID=UPI0031F719DF